jgi:hypothetical protein
MGDTFERLAECRRPFLIGVRHHSPACAVRMSDWLGTFDPQVVLLELPPQFASWLPWLAHPELEAPVALAGSDDRDTLFFYPFADFSPELAAVRWAARQGVPVVPFDLPAGLVASGPPCRLPGGRPDSLADWLERLEVSGFDQMWDELIEAPAPAATPEALRQAALLVGWVQRLGEAADPGLRARDLARETAMRKVLAERREERVAAVVGSFHAAALLDPPELWQEVPVAETPPAVRTSLVPYSFELLDSRSGYPAGIRDPRWQQEVFAAGLDPPGLQDNVSRLAVELCRALREQKQAAGSPDAQECVRLSLELARMRGLPAPGRREFLEAVQTSMAQGELLGRGRALAKALQTVLVARRRGRLAPDTPSSGLLPHTEEVLNRLRLPREPEQIRLDPLRSALDRSRHVTLRRLERCGVPYASSRESVDTLTQVWSLEWTPASVAGIEIAGFRGVTLAQAARGALLDPESPLLSRLWGAAECALGDLAEQLLRELEQDFLSTANLRTLLQAITTVDRIRLGQVPGLPDQSCGVDPVPVQAFRFDPSEIRNTLVKAALRSVDGLIGSTDVEDARALGDLLRLESPGLRLRHTLARMLEGASPLMQGAAAAALLWLEDQPPEDSTRAAGHTLAPRLSSWLQGPPDATMVGRWRGLLVLSAPLLQSHPQLLDAITLAVAELDDQAFLRRVPSLREAFSVLSAAERERFFAALCLTDRPMALSANDLAELALADLAGRQAVQRLGLYPEPSPPALSRTEPPAGRLAAPVRGELSLEERYRLLLGQTVQGTGKAARAARALDELYGHGQGEGSAVPLGGGGGQEEPSLGAWEWGEELVELFGEPVRQEVLGRAAERGRGAALLALDPSSVRPSVELLQQALSLVGSLSEAQMAKLRPLVKRVIDELVRELATLLRPAFGGLSTPRPTRRKTAELDLARTVKANLHTAHREGEGPWRLAPERLLFRTRARRSLDWRVVLVVDVSGSMEPSVIYSALMSAILAGLPAVTVHFVTFSTQVIDFSERAADPLALLLEVKVGGGTLIAPALAYARGLLQVPSRSLVILVSDFEDGGHLADLLAEVRALVESGARPLGLAALDDTGKPRYCEATASAVVEAGMPVAALTPLELARWVSEQIGSRGQSSK